MVELRKRKTPPPAPVRPAKKKAAPKPAKAEKPSKLSKAKAVVAEKVEAVKETVTGKSNGEKAEAPAPTPAAATSAGGPPKVGDTIGDVAAFGGEIETHEGTKTSLAKLLETSKGGVVLFTYPKASTPGCKYTQPFTSVQDHAYMIARRHKTGVLFPGLLHPVDGHRIRHLWSFQRQPQGQHHLQD